MMRNEDKSVFECDGVLIMVDVKNILVVIECDIVLWNVVIDVVFDCIIMMDEEGFVVEFNLVVE